RGAGNRVTREMERIEGGAARGARHPAATTAHVVTMSSTVAPRDRSLIGLAKPCRNGPIACAPASHCVSLYAIFPESRSGKIRTLACPATALLSFTFFCATVGTNAASA